MAKVECWGILPQPQPQPPWPEGAKWRISNAVSTDEGSGDRKRFEGGVPAAGNGGRRAEWSSGPGKTSYALPHQLELVEMDLAGAEGGFAIGEVVIPGAAEIVVEAESADLAPVALETLAPVPDRRHVVLAVLLDAFDGHAGDAAHGVGDGADGREVAAREDVLLNPVRAAAVGVVTLVGDGDDLQAKRPPVLRALPQVWKKVSRYLWPTASSISMDTRRLYMLLSRR